MWNEEQTTLIVEFCALAGLHDSTSAVLETGTVNCNDIPVTLLPAASSQSIQVYVQLGVPPEETASAIYRRLLELNLLLAHRQERLALEPGTGVAILSYELTAPAPAQLLTSLQYASARAHDWRCGYFLDDEEPLAQACTR
ncbi:CesT family type III secretion system chaperone [Lacisediminimonas sp.]|uniref:CesT family type III secretion system chaperone n=1 Tax=Lacisediminimonas sp. TaxID=3060582 RepID=UPI0027237AAE|nr:CesT family type III secretion system chaperone [Lacisediminimonas sp.]MDO8299795.1 CesT family type III secretion system chaperone [Lacisediminimonas sp.]MDO9218700.1 CesT family type III secretion system chaperone [Lacisediminimonas sp.]